MFVILSHVTWICDFLLQFHLHVYVIERAHFQPAVLLHSLRFHQKMLFVACWRKLAELKVCTVNVLSNSKENTEKLMEIQFKYTENTTYHR